MEKRALEMPWIVEQESEILWERLTCLMAQTAVGAFL